MIESFVNKEAEKAKNKKNMYYCLLGKQNFIDNENNPRINTENDTNTLAKVKFKDNGQPKYLIRIDHNKRLYNPLNKDETRIHNKPIDLLLPNSTSFKEVSSKVFDFYLSFLRTLNASWITHAEREDF